MKTFTTFDGHQVDGSSEEWRHHCEARTVLRMPTSERQAFLNLVGKRRGDEAMNQLRNTVQRMWTDDTAREIIALARKDLLASEQRLERIGRNGTLGERLRAGVERRMQEIISSGHTASNDNDWKQPAPKMETPKQQTAAPQRKPHQEREVRDWWNEAS
jgi:hypothetical protein